MTIRTNARVAGVTFLLYIAAGLTDMSHNWPPLPGTLLTFVECFSALVLAVTLYAITRQEDSEIAMLGMAFRVGEGLIGGMGLAVHSTSSGLVSATFFGAGSTCFCWLLLRGRMIPAWLAWLGLVASVLVIVVLPPQIAGAVTGPVTRLVWLPMLVFEVTFALWLLAKGVAPPVPRAAD